VSDIRQQCRLDIFAKKDENHGKEQLDHNGLNLEHPFPPSASLVVQLAISPEFMSDWAV